MVYVLDLGLSGILRLPDFRFRYSMLKKNREIKVFKNEIREIDLFDDFTSFFNFWNTGSLFLNKLFFNYYLIIYIFPVKLQGSFRSTVIYCLVTSKTGLKRGIFKSFQRISGKILLGRLFGN